MRHSSSSPSAASLPIGTVVTVGPRTGILVAYRPANMVDVRFEQTLNGAARSVVERCSASSVLPVARENPAKGLKKVIRAWEKTPQARPMLSVLRGVVLAADFTADTARRIPDDFLPETLIDSEEVQLVIGRDGTMVFLASDSPRRGAKSIRNAMAAGRTIRLTGPRGGLSEGQRASLPTETFAIPERRAWPINDRRHAEIAVQYMKRGFGKKSEYPRVKAEIRRRYPDVPVSNPAGQDFQDPENIQFRRVVAGITRSLVRKKLGMPAAPRSKEMTAADLRQEEALLLSLSPADLRAITSQAYAIATRQGQKHGWLKAGTQQPTAKAAARSEERMLLDPLEAQKDRLYEVVLARQRKSGFYRVVSREVQTGRSVQVRHYIEPAEDPTKPKYFLSLDKAEARKDEMNAALAMGQKPTLRNPRMNPEKPVLLKETTPDPFMELAAELNTPGGTALMPVTTEPADFTATPESASRVRAHIEATMETIAQNIAGGRGNRQELASNNLPFYDIERIDTRTRVIEGTLGQPKEITEYVIVPPEAPVTETQKLRFVLYLPKKYTYIGSRQKVGDVSLLTPKSEMRAELGTRMVGRPGERYEKEVELPYSQEARYLTQVINVPGKILEYFFSPFGTRSQMWDQYRSTKNFMKKRGLRPTMAKMWMPAPKSDAMVRAGRGTFDERKGKFVNQVSQNYQKFFTTNPDLFLFTIVNFKTPGRAFAVQYLGILLQQAQEAAFRAVQDAKYAGMSDDERLRAQAREVTPTSSTYVIPLTAVAQARADAYALSTVGQSSITEEDLNVIRNMNLGVELPSMEEMSAGFVELKELTNSGFHSPSLREAKKAVIEKTIKLSPRGESVSVGAFHIPGLGSKVVFPTAESAADWLKGDNAIRLYELIREIRRFTLDPISPITVEGIPFSAGEYAVTVLQNMVRKGFELPLERGAAVAEEMRDRFSMARARRGLGRLYRTEEERQLSLPEPEPVVAEKPSKAKKVKQYAVKPEDI